MQGALRKVSAGLFDCVCLVKGHLQAPGRTCRKSNPTLEAAMLRHTCVGLQLFMASASQDAC